ncbi:MAG TPA: TonB-dependent receptor [Vicinamibacterales bacterium]|nr:TonB-dependent receptor [Vicinamibacterales bacterium]
MSVGSSSLRIVVILLIGLCVVARAEAQTVFGAVEGTVKDESGGVLPGVTVEATSPALIEGTRSAVTDDTGSYKLLRLPVGTYALKFSLTGFTTVGRERVVINSGFTATINIDMKVGAMAETLTVVGESPVVDVKGTTGQTILTHEVVDAIPSARNPFDMSKFVLGASTSTPDVGGSTAHLYTAIQVHGSRGNDRGYYRDGVRVGAYFGDGDAPRAFGSTGAQQEINYQTTGLPAAVGHGGVAINLVSKDGGNQFGGSLFASGTNVHLQSSNLTQELRDLGVSSTNGAKKAYDIDGSFGGPIKHDKVWFFGSPRVLSFTSLLANQIGLDGQQAIDYTRQFNWFAKSTIQLTPHNKFTLSDAYDGSYRPYRRESATFVSDEAAGFNTSGRHPYNQIVGFSWTGTRGNSWIYEVGFGHTRVGAKTDFRPESTKDARLDQVSSTLTGAAIRVRADTTDREDYNASITHVANWRGSHELKVGSQGNWGSFNDYRYQRDAIILYTRNGVPDAVDLVNVPVIILTDVREFGFYAQDSWQLAKRLTFNVGVRYDWFENHIPAQHADAGRWVPVRDFAPIDVITWSNAVPRFGVAFDLFGNGRTVVKGSANKYMGVEAAGVGQAVNPLTQSSNRCVWTDLNGDNEFQDNEYSRCQGFAGGVSTRIDPNVRRPFNREYSVGFEHELFPATGLSVFYYRRENRDLRGTVNLAVPTASYIPVTITNPVTNQPLTIYNQNPATAGLQDNLLTNVDKLNFDYNGIEVAVQRRFTSRSSVLAGYQYGKATGRISTGGDLNDPNRDIFAVGAVGNDEPHQIKASGSYVLPGDVTLSGFLSSRSGHPRQRQLNVGRALVPTLTRSSQTVALERNDDVRYDRVTQLDLRFGRVFHFSGHRLEPFVDAYNLFNANTILADVTTIGTSLGRVSNTLSPRLVRLGAKVDF